MNLKTPLINPERADGLVETLQMSFREKLSTKVHLQLRIELGTNLTNMLYFNIDYELYKWVGTSQLYES